ncbi:MAG: hypothetical protein LBJ00_13075 [Planctomycetaceae bacterium]|nr:hypothetical protein [Planctomycetaceae bacterium]
MNNRFMLLRLPNALRCMFTAASGILNSLSIQLVLHLPLNYNNREK